ncbi:MULTISPECIES: winged helix-turn-helix domain-containing protein [unclassified Pantoea]|jgi:DNA-binding winged helix-turn-helix (wHTH) protein|uniref:winged helix-turn-helix domain-containing protein n=1 Tax=unclassified Pantoea TaxID=2630326 RepID=UPI0001E0B3B8|nr:MULTISPECIES: winged helix-turn-helix domain-containing protein [unclassified Pantoea]EFM19336.1 transcriptional regulator, CadC [Pantoea sp. aB]MDF2042160.1 winged helix-turn-helix domain-containing protein [Pantoea sp. Cr_R14]MDF2070626.1 winged helix-turn-helix domain-containing protein [Pantoea sp. Cr_R13]MDF2078268.1 winged helix-turn-helix domain-containing protein [Pantoea sp. Cr_R21]QNQ60049.1 winged helix-turn-helix domain-containing protein [Pantoea sp. MT58]
MKYIINACIGFSPADGVLYRIESEDSVTLPLPAQRLLLIILESEGEIVTRDSLLTGVWDQFGLVGSNSSLNQYLSLLRRSISAFGCENFIETLPKVGIRLCEFVHIQKIDEENNSDTTEVISKRRPSGPLSKMSTIPKDMNAWILIIAFLACSFIFFGISKGGGSSPTPVYHSLEDGCKLITFADLNDEALSRVKATLTVFMKAKGMQCKPGNRFYFDDLSSQGRDHTKRTLITYCEEDRKGKSIMCNNFYYFNEVFSEK